MKQTTAQKNIDEKFCLAGHQPENPQCSHEQWDEKTHGRYCPCGTIMVDFGD